jgi:hypothetical protein
MVLLLMLIQDFEGFNGFEKIGRACLGFFGCLADNLVKVPKMDEGNNRSI